MRLLNIIATPHASGNRIDLHWDLPASPTYPLVRVVRREGTYPTQPNPASAYDCIVVPEQANQNYAWDEGLQGETVYYYALFPYKTAGLNNTIVIDNPAEQIDVHNRVAVMATAPYNFAGQMYKLLPAIYHRYDTVLPRPDADISEADRNKGQLRRFLDLPGGQLDQLYSFARAILDSYNLDRVDGSLLHLLAQWIGWQTDYNLEIDAQRNELRTAPHIYKTIGIVPTVEATVKRILGWESRTKEFAHNIFLSNRPERLNLWLQNRDTTGSWSAPDLLSLDFAYEGRPTTALGSNGTLCLFYHTRRNDIWNIWYKTLSTFVIDTAFQTEFAQGFISAALRRVFAEHSVTLSEDSALVEIVPSLEWRITDPETHETYRIRSEAGQLTVFRWTPSQPLVKRSKVIDKYPTAAWQGDTLWVFWNSYAESEGVGHIHYCRRQIDGNWSTVTPLAFDSTGADAQVPRHQPAATVDHLGKLWLFWVERAVTGWQIKYNRHDGITWDVKSPHTFPTDAGQEPQVESDLFVLLQRPDTTSDGRARLWVFWARQVPTGGPLKTTRWQIFYRVATGVDPNEFTWIHSWSEDYPNHHTVDFAAPPPIDFHLRTWYVNMPLEWGPVQEFSQQVNSLYDDREPVAFVNADGKVELFWSATRNGRWSVWRSVLLDPESHAWGSATEVTAGPYSQRTPLPFLMAGETWLIYHTNESLTYTSAIYSATKTVDFRYAGSTSVDTRNLAKQALWGQYKDFQAYTYDAGQGGQRTDEDWYGRDTVGIYLTAETDDPRLLTRNRNILRNILPHFLPIQVRTVFNIDEPAVHPELVYTYDFPDEPQRLIGESFFDTLARPVAETIGGPAESYQDNMPGWVWMRSWSAAYSDHHTVDFTVTPVDIHLRSWHVGLTAGG